MILQIYHRSLRERVRRLDYGDAPKPKHFSVPLPGFKAQENAAKIIAKSQALQENLMKASCLHDELQRSILFNWVDRDSETGKAVVR